MKAIIASLLIIAATPFAFADDGLVFHPNGRHYVNVPRTCGLTAVARGQRCIEGFWVKGTPTRDWNNARAHLYGYGPGEGVIHLGSALIRDFNF